MGFEAKYPLAVSSLLYFLTEFCTFHPGSTLLCVYISPFFIRLSTPWLVDAIIWLIPGCVSIFILPMLCSGRISSNFPLNGHVVLILTGLVILLVTAKLGEIERGEYIYAVGMIGFVVMDVSIGSLNEQTNEVLRRACRGRNREEMRQWRRGWRLIGRVLGYFLASCDALQLGSRYIYFVTSTQNMGDNMIFTFSVAIAISVFSLLFVLPSSAIFPQQPPENHSKIDIFSFVHVYFSSPTSMKCLILAYYFSYSSSLLITTYTTSWVGISILNGLPSAEKYSLTRRVFETGVSWGAFALLLTSLVCMCSHLCVPRLTTFVSERRLWGAAQGVAGVGLIAVYGRSEVREILVILPLCGCALMTVEVIIHREIRRVMQYSVSTCPIIDHPHSSVICPSTPIYSLSQKLHLPTDFPLFSFIVTHVSLLAQVTMFSVVPCVFLLWPDLDDNRWGIVTAGCTAVLGAVCTLGVRGKTAI